MARNLWPISSIYPAFLNVILDIQHDRVSDIVKEAGRGASAQGNMGVPGGTVNLAAEQKVGSGVNEGGFTIFCWILIT